MRGMFVTGPPSQDDGTSLRVHSATGRTFDDVRGQVMNPTMRGYVRDMVAPYGLAVREDLLDEGAGHSYGEMCLPLLAELVPEDRPADLLVLATAIPDIRYGRTTATFLAGHCAGAPLGFTVSDQGLLAAFTALHLIEAYTRTGVCRRAVLLVAEQPTLYHELPVATPIPARAAAVGVVLEPGGPEGTPSVRRHTEVAEHDLAEVLTRRAGDRTTVLLGAGLAGSAVDSGDAVACGQDQPLTGVWQELSRRRNGGEPVLLAEYDPALGHLFTAALRFATG